MSDLGRPSFLRIFLPRLLGLISVLALGSTLLIVSRDRGLREEIGGDQESLVNMQFQRIQTATTSAVADAVYLSEIAAQKYLTAPDSVSFYGMVYSEFISFLRTRIMYDEVALLGPEGRERMRIERGPRGVRSAGVDDLRDHGDHDHISQIAGEPGLTWFSPVDSRATLQEPGAGPPLELFLNRLVTQEGAGSVLLRFSLRPFLAGLLSNQMGRRGALYLATESGEWLLGPGGVREGDSGGVEGLSPEFWSAVAMNREGQVLTPRGLFSYMVIELGVDHRAVPIPGSRVGAQEGWIIMTHVPPDLLRAGGRGFVVLVAFGVLMVLGSLLYAYSMVLVAKEEADSRLALSDQILSSVRDMVLVADAEGHVIFASPSVKDVLGYEVEDVLGDGWWQMTRPENAEAAAQEREETARRAQSEEAHEGSEYDREIRHQDGGFRWIRWRESPGPGSTVVGIGADVTERKEAEAARQRLTALIRHTSDFIGYAGLDGQCEFLNRGGLEMVGLDEPEEACQRTMFDFIHPEDLETLRDEILGDVMSGESWEGEVRLLHHAGAPPVPVHGEVFPILREETGEAVAVGGTFKNIEERKELEDSLMDAVRRAESANEAKQRFLANMSHEIRTPMNAIIGMADLLWETPLTPEQKDFVQVFRTAGDTLLALINDVLDLAKVEEGRLELERVGFDLQELLESVVDTFAVVAHGKGLEIAARVAPEVPTWVIGDPGRIRQILSNLVGNAVKFTQKGHVLVEVTEGDEADCLVEPLPGTTEEHALLKFSVQDSGVGIPQEKLEDVFGRFTQADSSTTRRFGGSGLGLAICERLVSVMGGRIWVESTVGVGSSFQMAVRLPVTRAPVTQDSDLEDLRGVSFLVVDDNAINRLILREVLHTWGALVEECPDATAAMAALRERTERGQPFKVCLLDAEMPDMDGYSLAKEIKDDPGLGRPLVFMLTSHGDGRSKSEMERLGLSGHMMKPVRRPTLLHALTGALSQEASGRDSDPVPDGSERSGVGMDAETMKGDGADVASERSFRILVVDDSADNRMLINAYLKKTEYEVEYAENGQEALEKCVSEGPFDLVFMDIQMPVMDGYEATGAIRKWEADNGAAPLKIFALSAHAMQEEVQKSIDAGCDDHLTKPIKKKRLLEAIQEVVEGRIGGL